MALSVTNLGIDGLQDVEQIGTGGSSRVYRARQVDLDRVVAIKVLNPGGDPGVAKRFDRERKAMGRLSLHEGIVPVYSSGVTSHGEPYLVMPYYANGSLQDQIDAGPMEWETAVSYVDVAAETIAAAHDEGVVHLDLKPANILLTTNGAPRIADFGIARLTGTVTAGITAGTVFTPAYSAPETFLEGETGPPSDVYGLSATLWALLVGHPPFLTPGDDSNLMAVIGRVVNNQVGDLRHIAPAAICDVVERAMAKRPEDRYQTAREFSLALKEAAAGASVSFVPPVRPATESPALFDGAVTASKPIGPVAADSDPPFGLGDPAATPAAADATMVGERSLLHDASSQSLASPVQAPPSPRSPIPLIDLDRLRVGPFLLGGLAFLLIVGGVAWVFFRGAGDATSDADGRDLSTAAAPSTGSTAGGIASAGSDADLAATTANPLTTTRDNSDLSGAGDGSSTSGPTSTSDSSTTTVRSSTTGPSSTRGPSTSASGSSTSAASTTAVPTTPEAPVGLTAAATSGSDVELAWSAPSSGPRPVSYVVLRNGVRIREDVNRTSFADRGLNPGTYTYAVRAVGADGSPSTTSGSATVTVGPLEIMSFTATRTAESPGLVSVSFSANHKVTYRIRAVSDDGENDPPVVTNQGGEPTDSASALLTLDPATDYQVNLSITVDGEEATDFRRVAAPSTGE